MTPVYGGIEIHGQRTHLKASEAYVDVTFRYPGGVTWVGSVPYQYRRTGIAAETDEEKREVIERAYAAMHPAKATEWMAEQAEFWLGSKAEVTRPFFDALARSEWTCQRCSLPSNPNWARRVQDLKEMGYTLATDTSRHCSRCKRSTTHLLLLRLPRGSATGYETWSPKLRARILKVLQHWDAFESCRRQHGLLPDHKFPEIRWDHGTGQANSDDMTETEIRAKFQLLTNQRNQQKREACRACFQTGERGTIFGIRYFYEGGASWPASVPVSGKVAEAGCAGCGWYDVAQWKDSLTRAAAGGGPRGVRRPGP